jgi:hypothetical protein
MNLLALYAVKSFLPSLLPLMLYIPHFLIYVGHSLPIFYEVYVLYECKDIHKKTKVMPYKTLIRTVLTYGSETWTLSKNSENALSTFERKILRRIYGPVQDNGQWRIRYNKELYELYGEPDLVTRIKLKRLQ